MLHAKRAKYDLQRYSLNLWLSSRESSWIAVESFYNPVYAAYSVFSTQLIKNIDYFMLKRVLNIQKGFFSATSKQ